jgi:hypothetical protein
LDEYYPHEEAERQFATAVDWGRYAELFEYDAGEDRLYLPYLYVKIGGGDTLVVQTDGDNSSQLRDLVPVHISGDLCHLFDLQGEAVLKTRRHHLA